MTFVYLFIALLLAIPQAASDLSPAKHSDPVPPEIASAIATTLAPGGTKVTAGQATLQFWWVKELPMKAGGPALSWTDVGEGTLVGALKIDHDYRDIRGRIVRAGTYTLRYGIQPANGDHLGVSPFREFLLVCPVAADTDPAPVGHDGAIAISKQTIGGSHPAVLSMDPPVATEPAGAVHSTDLGHQAVIMEVPVARDGKPAGTLRFGVVVIGRIEA
jgi:hypothetical protein